MQLSSALPALSVRTTNNKYSLSFCGDGWHDSIAGSVLTGRVGNAAVAAAVTIMLWSQAPAGRWAARAVRSAAGVSALMLLFLVYNVAAGGNPPKGEKPAIEQECDVLESSCDK